MWKSQVINLLKVGMPVFTAIMIVHVVLVISCLNILISQKFLVSGINAKYYIPVSSQYWIIIMCWRRQLEFSQ